MELKETPNSAEQEDHSLLTSQPPVHIIKSTSKDGRQGKGKQDIFCLNLKWGENSKERWFLQDVHLSKQRYIYFELYFWGTFLEKHSFIEFCMYWYNSHGIEFDTCCFTACSLHKSRSINEDKYFKHLGHEAKSFQVFSVPMSSKLFARSFSKMSHLSSSFRISWRCENDAKEEKKKRNPIV